MKIDSKPFNIKKKLSLSIITRYFPAFIFAATLILATEIPAWASSPAISSVILNPTSAGQGATAKTIAVYGTGFQCGVQMIPSDPTITTPNDSTGAPFQNQCPSGIVPSNVRFFSSSNVFVYLNVANTTPAGPVTLTFKNPNGDSATANLTINLAPTITSVTTNPALILQGSTFTAALNGSGFQNGGVLTFSPPGLTLNSLFINGTGTQAVASISASPTAAPSNFDMVLTNPDGGTSRYLSAFGIQPVLGQKTPAMAVDEDPRLTNTVHIPYSHFWNGVWSDEATVRSSGTYYTPHQLTLIAHPFLFQQMTGHVVNSAFEFQVWNQGTWGSQLIAPGYPAGTKNFDMAYEPQSGNGLAIYGTFTGIAYRQFFQTGVAGICDPLLANAAPCWGPENVISTPNYLYWAKLAPNPDRTKNEILFAYEDSSGKLFIRSWNGTSFSGEVQVSSLLNAAAGSVAIPFDLAYTQSGHAGMLAWIENNNGIPKSCIWNGTSNTCPLTSSLPLQMGSASSTNLFSIGLSPDPASDQIALGTVEYRSSGSTLKVQIWNGTSWPAASYPTDLRSVNMLSNALYVDQYSSWPTFSFVWENSSPGKLFALYTYLDPVSGGGGIHDQTWDGAAGWSGDQPVPGIPVSGAGNLPLFVSVGSDADPRSGDILSAMKTINGIFYSLRWDGLSAQWLDLKQLGPGEGYSSYSIGFGISYFKDFPMIDPATTQTTVQQGASLTLVINGTLIQDGATLSFPGFTAANLTVTHLGGVDTLTATGIVGSQAIPGLLDITITNPDRTWIVGKGLINLTPNPANPPTVYSISPASRGQGAANQALIISGYNFPSSASVSFSGNGDITVTNQTRLSPTQISAQINVAQNAVVGAHNLILTDSLTNTNYPFSGLFTVNYAPSIISVTPGTLVQGGSQNISITGNDFQKGASLVILDGSSSLGWRTPGTIASHLYQNQMTGNRFYITGTSAGVILAQISLFPSLVDPLQPNAEVAIYDDNGGIPGNLIAKSSLQALTTGQNANFSFGLSPPVFLSTPAYYWILFNVDGAETVIPHDDNITTCSVDGYASPCLQVSKAQSFGSWPTAGGSGWTTTSGKRLDIDLIFYPLTGSTTIGTNTLGVGNYKNQMTGSNILTFTAPLTSVPLIFAYIGAVDTANKGGSVAIYDSTGTGGAPGALARSGTAISTNPALVPNSFNAFTMPRNTNLQAGTYWVLVNVNGAGTTLQYETGAGISQSAVQSAQTYGTWPGTFPAATTTANTRYSIFGAGTFGLLGNLTATGTDGTDSNQMTGSQFATTTLSNIVGLSFYVNTVDAANPSGSAAIYDNDPVTQTPRNLIVSSAAQTLRPASFNSIPLPVTQLPAGTYWLLVNMNGPGTTLTYDEGTSVSGIKKPNLFTNPWPNPGGPASGWTPFPGRRYSISVVPDIGVNSNLLSSNLISASVSADTAATTGQRGVCVVNPDGGVSCVTTDANNQPYFQIIGKIQTNQALTSYGIAGSNFPAYRKWNGYAPWELESTTASSAGGAGLWSVLQAYPHGNPADPRREEKIQGTLSGNATLTVQVWDGALWNSPLSLITAPSNTVARSFDIAYESQSGNGMVAYGVSGNSNPQYQIWNGSTWSAPAALPGAPSGVPLWIRLESNPMKNEMLLAYLSGTVNTDNSISGANLHLLVWNGMSFANEQVINLSGNINLCGTCSPPVAGQIFDVAYEHRSGRGIVVWDSPANPVPNTLIWNGAVWMAGPAANQAAADTSTTLIYFKLSADPNSDQIALGTGSLNAQYMVQLWNGSDWGPAAVRSGSAPGPSFTLTGEWSSTAVISPPASPGSEQFSHLAADSAEFTFSGTEIDLIGQKRPDLGIATLYLDGEIEDRIDYYYPSPTEKMVLYSLTHISTGTHTLRIEPSGLRNNLATFSGGTTIDSTMADHITGSLFTARKTGPITLGGVFINTYDPGYATSDPCGFNSLSTRPEFQIAIYTDNNGTPGTFLGSGTQPCLGTPQDWISAGIASVTLTKDTKYWILINGRGNGTTITYSTGSGTSRSVKLAQPYGAGTGIWPVSFPTGTAWTPSGVYYSLYASTAAGSLEEIVSGTAPSVAADAFDVKNGSNAPSLVSANLLYYASPAAPSVTDPNNVGRNFDLAWEKNSGTLITVFGSPRSINSCRTTDFLPYGTRFKKWDTINGWSADVLVPLIGKDLVPRWIQLTPDTSSNDLFLGISGQPAITDVTGFCNVATTQLHYHQYIWHSEAWNDKEVLNSNLSGLAGSILFTGISESFSTAFDADSMPPSPVTDLTITATAPGSATLRWTSTGDDGNLGKAASYSIYYSTSSTFSASTALPFTPVFLTSPSVPEPYVFTVNNLSPSTTYYFAITAVDRAGNVSPLSTNNPSATVPASGGTGLLSPAAIRDLMVVPGSLANNSAQFTWTAPFISAGYNGAGAAYDFRWSTGPIVDDITFNAANPVVALDGRNGLPSPHLAGTREIFNLVFNSVNSVGLPTGTIYFAIKTCGPLALNSVTLRCDSAMNPSAISFINTNNPVSLNNGGSGSLLPPSPISDLVITGVASNSMTLRWTAPGNSGQTGTAAQYDIRVSPAQITTVNFANARQVVPAPPPLPAGTVQSFAVTNLLSNTTSGIPYYFAIKTVNASGTLSDMSNVAVGTTLPVFDLTPPSAIKDLSVVRNSVNNSSVILSWTATGDDGAIGTAMQYDIRYSEFPIVDDTAFYNPVQTIQVPNPPFPGPSGRLEFFPVTGLNSNTLYYFAVKAIDKADNPSPVSTCPACPGHTALQAGYNLVSVPYRLPGPNDPASVFGNDVSKPVTVYQWNGAYSVPSIITGGDGYFLYSIGKNSILRATDPSGNLLGIPETSPAVTVPLQTGWNMTGNPYLHPVYLKDTCVKKGSGTSVPYPTAVAYGWVGNSIYSYDGTRYIAGIFLDPLNILPPALLGPWNGYWVQLIAADTPYSLVYLDTPGACP
ncbi:MAG: fibronectin type III domain-containing protein [Nitrospiria bacterium]